jgi:hypothetical protein
MGDGVQRERTELAGDLFETGLGRGAVVVVGGEEAQGIIDLGRHQQQEHAQLQGQRAGAQLQVIDEGEADIEGDAGDAERSEEFEHGRGQEGDAQHLERALAQGLARLDDARGLPSLTTEEFEGEHALQAIGKAAGEMAEGAGLAVGGDLGAPADQGHEGRNERRGDEEQEARHPIERQDDGAEDQWQQRGLQGGRQIAGEIAIECFDLIDNGRGRDSGCRRIGRAR